MGAQDGRRGLGSDFALETSCDSFGFAGVRDDTKNLFRPENLTDGHRDRAPGDVGQVLEPAFAELLPAACLIEMDHDVSCFGLKIGGRIVEGQVPVLADADESYVDWGFAKFAGDLRDGFGWVLLAVQKMVMGDADFGD